MTTIQKQHLELCSNAIIANTYNLDKPHVLIVNIEMLQAIRESMPKSVKDFFNAKPEYLGAPIVVMETTFPVVVNLKKPKAQKK